MKLWAWKSKWLATNCNQSLSLETTTALKICDKVIRLVIERCWVQSAREREKDQKFLRALTSFSSNSLHWIGPTLEIHMNRMSIWLINLVHSKKSLLVIRSNDFLYRWPRTDQELIEVLKILIISIRSFWCKSFVHLRPPSNTLEYSQGHSQDLFSKWH